MVTNSLLKKVSEGLNVLCVEDNEELRNELVETLGFFFTSVKSASNGLEAHNRLASESFDIVITDIRMPHMDGIELIRKTKNNTTKTQFIVISAHGNDKDMFDLLELGISKFIPKPISSVMLKQCLYEVCRNVYDLNISNYYIDELANANLALSAKIEELEATKKALERTISTLEVKIEQINKLNEIVKKSDEPEEQSENGLVDCADTDDEASEEDDFELSGEDIDEILELESSMDSNISMSVISRNMDVHQIEMLAKNLIRYSTILKAYIPIEQLSIAIEKLGLSIKNNSQTVYDKFERVMAYLESMSFVLIKWRQNTQTKLVDIHYFDASIINDIDMIVSVIEGTLVEAEEIDLF